MKISYEAANNLVSILNFLWTQNQDDWGPVEETGFGFTNKIGSENVESFEMADGSSFEEGLETLWRAIQEGDIE